MLSFFWHLQIRILLRVLVIAVLNLCVKDAVKTKSLMLLHVAELIAKLELGIVVLVEILVLRVDVDVRFVVLLLLGNENFARAFVFKRLHLIYSFTEIDNSSPSEKFYVWIDLLNTLHKTNSFISRCLDIIN